MDGDGAVEETGTGEVGRLTRVRSLSWLYLPLSVYGLSIVLVSPVTRIRRVPALSAGGITGVDLAVALTLGLAREEVVVVAGTTLRRHIPEDLSFRRVRVKVGGLGSGRA